MFSLINILGAVGLAAAATAPLVQRDTVNIIVCKGQDLTGNCMYPTIITQSQCCKFQIKIFEFKRQRPS